VSDALLLGPRLGEVRPLLAGLDPARLDFEAVGEVMIGALPPPQHVGVYSVEVDGKVVAAFQVAEDGRAAFVRPCLPDGAPVPGHEEWWPYQAGECATARFVLGSALALALSLAPKDGPVARALGARGKTFLGQR